MCATSKYDINLSEECSGLCKCRYSLGCALIVRISLLNSYSLGAGKGLR